MQKASVELFYDAKNETRRYFYARVRPIIRLITVFRDMIREILLIDWTDYGQEEKIDDGRANGVYETSWIRVPG